MISQEVENRLVRICIDNEYQKSLSDGSGEVSDFESYLDLFDAIRSQKDYDWMSDIFIPEFPSHMLSMQADDAATYFQTRDFVECYVMDSSQEAIDAAKAGQECINRTLNRRDLYHYQKYLRGKTINHLAGYVWLEAWWERESREEVVGLNEYMEEQYGDVITKDQFNYDILDPRNVFCDSRYVYSAQQKEWITVRSETTIDKLKKEAAANDYFNLDKIGKASGKSQTQEAVEDKPEEPADNTIDKPLDKLRRYGKFWMKDGKPGLDRNGEPVDGAELVECLITFVISGSTRTLIGFKEQPYEDVNGNKFRPLIRGLCYVHPTRDNGAGDGKYAAELQVGINDTFNLNNDRTFLATMPTFKGKRNVVQDTDTLYMKPMHVMEMESPDDLTEIVIKDNIQGGLTQLGVLTDKLRQITAVTPPDLGSVPELSSTTATAVSKAGQGSDRRAHLKALTYENTALCELYWMILQMTWQFASPETGEKLLGDKLMGFNPAHNFFYRPLSQSIESEQSKAVKSQRLLQMMGVIAPVIQLHPSFLAQWNQLYQMLLELMGDEFVNIRTANEKIPVRQDVGGGSAQQVGGMNGGPQNQYGMQQSEGESYARQTAGGGYY